MVRSDVHFLGKLQGRPCDCPMGISESPGERTVTLPMRMTPPTQKDRERRGEEGHWREGDPQLVSWETALIPGLPFHFLGMLECKFTLNPSLTSSVSPLVA